MGLSAIGEFTQNVVQSYVKENMMFQPLNYGIWGLSNETTPSGYTAWTINMVKAALLLGMSKQMEMGLPVRKESIPVHAYSDHDTLETSIKNTVLTCVSPAP